MVRYALFLLLICGNSSVAQVPESNQAKRMSRQQYDKFLNELDSKLPLLLAHFQTLCATPGWRRQDSDAKFLADQLFSRCRGEYGTMLPYLEDSVKTERLTPRLSVEFKVQYALQELLNLTGSISGARPYYDSRPEDADYVLKNVGPLALALYSHVYASIDDDRCKVF